MGPIRVQEMYGGVPSALIGKMEDLTTPREAMIKQMAVAARRRKKEQRAAEHDKYQLLALQGIGRLYSQQYSPQIISRDISEDSKIDRNDVNVPGGTNPIAPPVPTPRMNRRISESVGDLSILIFEFLHHNNKVVVEQNLLPMLLNVQRDIKTLFSRQ